MNKLDVPWHVSFEALPVLNGFEPGYGIVFGDYDPATSVYYDTDVIIGADIIHERATMERIVADHNRMLEIRTEEDAK
jgi:hypothetical protein